MSTSEEAMGTALGILSSGILGWSNDLTTGQLILIYDGDPGVSSINITVLIADASTEA